jgi:hypothetical protein
VSRRTSFLSLLESKKQSAYSSRVRAAPRSKWRERGHEMKLGGETALMACARPKKGLARERHRISKHQKTYTKSVHSCTPTNQDRTASCQRVTSGRMFETVPQFRITLPLHHSLKRSFGLKIAAKVNPLILMFHGRIFKWIGTHQPHLTGGWLPNIETSWVLFDMCFSRLRVRDFHYHHLGLSVLVHYFMFSKLHRMRR